MVTATSLVLMLSGCGDDDTSDPDPSAAPSEPTPSERTPADTASTSASPTATFTASDNIVVEAAVDADFATQFTAVADGDLWFPNPDEGTVTRVDGRSGKILATIKVAEPRPPLPQAVTADPSGQVWVAATSAASALRVDPKNNRVSETVKLPVAPYGIAVTATDIWATGFEQGLIVRVDRATGREVARLTDLASPTAVVVAHDAVWVAEHRTGQVARIDPTTNKVTDIVETGSTLERLTSSSDAIWAAANTGSALVRVDPTSLEQTSLSLGSNAYGVAVSNEGIWVTIGPQQGCDETNSYVVLVDPERLEERGRVPIGCAFAVAAGPTGLVIAGSDGFPPALVPLRWRQ